MILGLATDVVAILSALAFLAFVITAWLITRACHEPFRMAVAQRGARRAARPLLPRSITGRLLLGVLALPLLLAAGWGLALSAFAGRPMPADPLGVAVTIVVIELAAATFTIGLVALLWAIAAPRSIEALASRAAVRAGVLAFGALTLVFVVYAFLTVTAPASGP